MNPPTDADGAPDHLRFEHDPEKIMLREVDGPGIGCGGMRA
jgi:hypothetical protein